MYPPELENKDTTEGITPASYLDLLLFYCCRFLVNTGILLSNESSLSLILRWDHIVIRVMTSSVWNASDKF